MLFQYQLINPIIGLDSYTMLAWQYKDSYGDGSVFFINNNGNMGSGLTFDSGTYSLSLMTKLHRTLTSSQIFQSTLNLPLRQWMHVGFKFNITAGIQLE